MRLCWITDPHLNFLRTIDAVKALAESLTENEIFDAVVVTGDIAEADSVGPLLGVFTHTIQTPVYFILGNHDMYHGSFQSVRESLEAMPPALLDKMVWLDRRDPVLLTDTTALCGHTGWFDGGYGDAERSSVVMNDFKVVADLSPHYNDYVFRVPGGRVQLLEKLRHLSTTFAEEARDSLRKALAARDEVLFLTHFPPFEGACWHEGQLSNKDWMPWFTSKAMGDMLSQEALAHPDKKITVLCGHTHSPGAYQHMSNLRVLTGKARYGFPSPAGFVDVV